MGSDVFLICAQYFLWLVSYIRLNVACFLLNRASLRAVVGIVMHVSLCSTVYIYIYRLVPQLFHFHFNFDLFTCSL